MRFDTFTMTLEKSDAGARNLLGTAFQEIFRRSPVALVRRPCRPSRARSLAILLRAGRNAIPDDQVCSDEYLHRGLFPR